MSSSNMRTLLLGATGYLGAEIADQLCCHACDTVLLARKPRKLTKLADTLEAAYPKAQPLLYPLDMGGATPADYADMAERIQEALGGLDAVVFSTASFPGLKPLANTPPLELLTDLHIGITAPLLITQAVMPLLEQSRGQVMFIEDSTERCGKAYWGAYSIAQHALRGSVQLLREECEHAGVSVHGFEAPAMRAGVHAKAFMVNDDAAATLADAKEVAHTVVEQLLSTYRA